MTHTNKEFIPKKRIDALDDVIGQDIRILEAVLTAYRRISKNKIEMTDLIKDNLVLTTNMALLEDAAAYTKDLESNEEIERHLRAKEVFLLWCIIFCEKMLLKKYSKKTKDSRERIFAGTKKGAMYNYEVLRNRLREYFDTPEHERGSVYFALRFNSVKSFMYQMADNRTKDEFRKAHDLVELKIPVDMLKGCNKVPEDIDLSKVAALNKFIEENLKNNIAVLKGEDKRYYTCNQLIKKDIYDKVICAYEEKNIKIFEGKYGWLYYNRFNPYTLGGKENESSFVNPEVPEKIIERVEYEAQKLMDLNTIYNEVNNMFNYMIQNNKIDKFEAEFFRDVISSSKMRGCDKFRQWQEKGALPTEKTVRKYRENILKKMHEVMMERPEWMALQDLVK